MDEDDEDRYDESDCGYCGCYMCCPEEWDDELMSDTVVVDIAIATPQEFQIEIPRETIESIKQQMEGNTKSLQFVDSEGILVVIPFCSILSLAIMEKQEGVEVQSEPTLIHNSNYCANCAKE